MRDGEFSIDVIQGPVEVDAVIALSKLHQATLGPLPFEAFRDAARQGWIVGAWSGEDLVGYLLYRPRKRDGVLSITHLCVASQYQRRGVARRLVDALSARHPYSPGMVLWCRVDYPATARWPGLGFDREGRKTGKSKAGHELIRWRRPISAATLLTYLPSTSAVPAAAVDTDVFRDIVEPREKYIDSIALDADWLTEFVELVTTAQLGSEVELAAEMDPGLRGASIRYRQLQPPPEQWEPIKAELDAELAGTAVGDGDRRNLAQAAAGGASYFVTRDKAVLARAASVESVTGLKVLEPGELGLTIHADQYETAYHPEALHESDYEVLHPTRYPKAAELGPFVDAACDRKASVLANSFQAVGAAVQSGGRLWELSAPDGVPVALAATTTRDEVLIVNVLRVRSGTSRETFARQLLHRFREEAVAAGLASVAVSFGEGLPDYVTAALVQEGYAQVDDDWRAECSPGTVGANEPAPCVAPATPARKLPAETVSLLERRLWPLKILSGNVPTYIVPIQPAWARALFDDAPEQLELVRRPGRLGIAREHVYYCSLKTTIVAPARLLWWVSGQGANSGMRAWSWLDDVAHERPRTLFKRFGSQGIFEQSAVEALAKKPGQRATALVFSRTETFVRPIKLGEARAIHPDMTANGYLQTAKRVDEHVFERFLQHGSGAP